MPIYEYKCQTCANEFETLVLPNSDVPTCPACHGTSLERKRSLFAVSSDATRKASFSKAKEANKKVLREKAVADQEIFDHHDH